MTTSRIGNRDYPNSYLEKLRAVQPLARAALRKLDRNQPVAVADAPRKKCRKCKEYWPATAEFFFRSAKNGNLRSPCKACISEKRAATNAVKPCAVAGCDQPRYSPRYSYCWEHRDTLKRKVVES